MGQQTSTSTGGRTEAPSLQQALEFARRAHAGQLRRQNGHPFIEHPVAVVEILAAEDLPDDVLAAGYLHDTVEKCDVNIADLRRLFGERVALIVAALSEDKSIEDYDERKRALRASALGDNGGAALVYAADRLANIRDWVQLDPEQREAAARRLGTAYSERLALWREDLAELTANDPDLPFLAEIELELRNLT